MYVDVPWSNDFPQLQSYTDVAELQKINDGNVFNHYSDSSLKNAAKVTRPFKDAFPNKRFVCSCVHRSSLLSLRQYIHVVAVVCHEEVHFDL